MNEIISNNKDIMETIQNIYKNAQPEDLRKLIAKHLMPTIEEKKKFAEIPTPVSLVDEMLEKIPSVFWTKPKTVLEPCCGKGNFVIGIFDKLYEGMKEHKSNKVERCELIVTNCLYYGDITDLNVFTTTELLKCHIKSKTGQEEINYEFNSYVGDTLDEKFTNAFKIKKFDAVIGNPPYNKSKDGVLKGGYGGRSLWDKFVEKALEGQMVENGYLLYVHPPSWRKPEHYLWKKMSSKQILYIKSYSEQESSKIFGCATTVDYYLLKNTKVYEETEFYGQDKRTSLLDLRKWGFLPSGCIDEIKKILGKNEVIYSSSIYDTRKKYISTVENVEYMLPVVHSMTQKNGVGFVYSKEDKGQFNVPKVILSLGRHQYPYNDWKGEYGMSNVCFGLHIGSKEDGDNIVKAINSEKFKEIVKYTKWSTFQTDWRMFKGFKQDFWKEFV